jgi:hypothetical protein
MDFHADDDFPIIGGALDEFFGIGGAGFGEHLSFSFSPLPCGERSAREACRVRG